MLQYGVGGRAASGNNGEPLAVLWNPSSSVTLWVVQVQVCHTAANSQDTSFQRTTTRGTPGSTVTPDIDSNVENLIAPPSGALLDLADFTVTPTIDASVLGRFVHEQVVGAGFMLPFAVNAFRPVRVPPGTGFGVIAPSVATRIRDVAIRWVE